MQKLFSAMPATPDQIYEELEPLLTEFLNDHRHRRTPERYAVLDVVCKQKRAFTAEHLYEELSKTFPCSLATIYNTLQLFEKCHIVHRINKPIGQRLVHYERAKRRGIHMEMTCTNCGRVQEFYDKSIVAAIDMHRFNNFNAKSFSLYVYGKCKYCRNKIN